MAKLISVHFPKAAGSAVGCAFEAAFGANGVLRDYSHDPMGDRHPDRHGATKPLSLVHHSVVHGHFHIGLYDRISDAVRVVALREPVDNLMSIYYFWDNLRRSGFLKGNRIYRYFCQSGIDLIDFARFHQIRYLMCDVYFRKLDMKCFDVIGDYANLNGYLQRVATLIGVEFGDLPKVNVTPPSDERRTASEDPHTLARLRDLLADDLRFYERYCSR